MSIKETQLRVHLMAAEKGWWDPYGLDTRRGCFALSVDEILAKIALIHAEASEAVEAVRRGEPVIWRDESGKPEGLAIELADIVIRVMDLCGGLGIELEEAIAEKIEFNATRPERHGGRLA